MEAARAATTLSSNPPERFSDSADADTEISLTPRPHYGLVGADSFLSETCSAGPTAGGASDRVAGGETQQVMRDKPFAEVLTEWAIEGAQTDSVITNPALGISSVIDFVNEWREAFNSEFFESAKKHDPDPTSHTTVRPDVS
jgi:hypothetical protein|uniref:Uncharacterized protein n=1 Tax=Haptolina ericina TaxID=156174 RepID=A0A7S3EWS2_9EUKA|mmetsp:Transcript_26039/g.59139  ORF Transcript_26039/g.59139 Transcript_26039/m.59139 type:complete len:142 (+) Transcript_26039:168-593(+)